MRCKTFVEMLERHAVMGKSQAYKLIDVVDNYGKREALELGLEKAHGLVRRVVEKLTAAEIVREPPKSFVRRA